MTFCLSARICGKVDEGINQLCQEPAACERKYIGDLYFVLPFFPAFSFSYCLSRNLFFFNIFKAHGGLQQCSRLCWTMQRTSSMLLLGLKINFNKTKFCTNYMHSSKGLAPREGWRIRAPMYADREVEGRGRCCQRWQCCQRILLQWGTRWDWRK